MYIAQISCFESSHYNQWKVCFSSPVKFWKCHLRPLCSKPSNNLIWIASADFFYWLSCIVGNVGARFEKQSTGVALQSCNIVQLIMYNFKQMIKINKAEPDTIFFTSFCLSNSGAYITLNANQPLSDITGGSLSDDMWLHTTFCVNILKLSSHYYLFFQQHGTGFTPICTFFEPLRIWKATTK